MPLIQLNCVILVDRKKKCTIITIMNSHGNFLCTYEYRRIVCIPPTIPVLIIIIG